MKTTLILLLLASGLSVQAQNINYNYFELGYDYLDLSNNNADGLYLDAGFDLTERTYMGINYSNLSANGPDVNRYGLSFGFHINTESRTDFYTELAVGQIDNRFGDSLTYGLNFGTRIAFNKKFELITKVGYTEIDDFDDGYFEGGMTGLFKISSAHAITAGLQSLDGDLGASVGFRFSF